MGVLIEWPRQASGTRDHGPLTQREHELMSLLAAGLGLQAVVEKMGIERRTAHRHLRNIYEKLGARSRPHAVALAYARGLVEIR
ncbi:MAG: helix-turn-helix transcriptional regulator [Chloroflexi bacterium]|nr:helix-turn-helix transcriptional regulator [Chloroflexota bacterium]